MLASFEHCVAWMVLDNIVLILSLLEIFFQQRAEVGPTILDDVGFV
jgi:hypothetical protein